MTKATPQGRFGTKQGKEKPRKRTKRRMPDKTPNKGKRVKMVQPMSLGPAGPGTHIDPEHGRDKAYNP